MDKKPFLSVIIHEYIARNDLGMHNESLWKVFLLEAYRIVVDVV
jgi:hypothetical protein